MLRRQCSNVHTRPFAQTPKRYISSNQQSQTPQPELVSLLRHESLTYISQSCRTQ